METSLKKWGGICMMAGVLLMCSGNVLMRLELMPESAMLILGVLWGHGLMGIAVIGLAVSVMNHTNRGRVMGALVLTLLGNVLLAAIIGIALTFNLSAAAGTMETLIADQQMVAAHNLIGHFGVVIGMLVLLTSALGNSAYSKMGLYLFLLGVVVVGVGMFISETVFGAGFIPVLIGGLWTGWDLMSSAEASDPATASAGAMA